MKLYITGDMSNITYDFFESSIISAIRDDYNNGNIWHPTSIISSNRKDIIPEYYARIFAQQKNIPIISFVKEWFGNETSTNYSYYRSLEYNIIDFCDVMFYFTDKQIPDALIHHPINLCDDLFKSVYIMRKPNAVE